MWLLAIRFTLSGVLLGLFCWRRWRLLDRGYLLGGALVDGVCEPLMAGQTPGSLLVRWFGSGKGSGAALLFFLCGAAGVAVCLVFSLLLKRYRWTEAA